MGNRLTQIATRTGDAGTTGLGNNQRVSKNSLRVHAMGDVDELNSHIGLLLCEPMPEDVRALLVEVQHQLFNLGGELSIPGFELLKPEAVIALDEALGDHATRHVARLADAEHLANLGSGSLRDDLAGVPEPGTIALVLLALGLAVGVGLAVTTWPGVVAIGVGEHVVRLSLALCVLLVVPGTLPSSDGRCALYCAVIVKKVDAKTIPGRSKDFMPTSESDKITNYD